MSYCSYKNIGQARIVSKAFSIFYLIQGLQVQTISEHLYFYDLDVHAGRS